MPMGELVVFMNACTDFEALERTGLLLTFARLR